VSNVIPASSLISPLENVDNSAHPDQVQDSLASNQSELNTAYGNRSEQWKSTASATAKPLYCGAKESTDALPPLGSVIGVLSGVEGSEPAQRNSHLHSEVRVEGTTETGPTREGSDVGGKEAVPADDPPTSIPSIVQGGRPDGTRTALYLFCL